MWRGKNEFLYGQSDRTSNGERRCSSSSHCTSLEDSCEVHSSSRNMLEDNDCSHSMWVARKPPFCSRMQYRDHSRGFYPNAFDVMDSSMDTSNSLSSSNDTKPDIMQLNVGGSSSSTSAPFSGLMGISGGGGSNISRYSQSGGSVHVGYHPSQQQPPSSQVSGSSGYFDIGRLSMTHSPGVGGGGGSSGMAPLQSPALHSQSSMSPVQFQHSPSGGTSGGGFMPMQSPTSTMGPPFHPSQTGMSGMVGGSSGQHNMSSMTKHICAICGDRASGKHYGVYSCEGCKGFFKRTVRKDLQYACRDEKVCLIDKRQRNRCQYCRYMKCLTTGMKREAVQEERQRAREKGEVEVESTTSANSDMPVEMILDAEMCVDALLDSYVENPNDPMSWMYQAAEKQVYSLVEWVKHIPHFVELPLDDQVILMRSGWNELLIAGFSHLSMAIKDGIMLAHGLCVYRNNAAESGIGFLFDRVLTELVSKIREMSIDRTEIGCLRAIVLFNPDAKGLGSVQSVESLREKVYTSLEEYCKQQLPDEPGRFAKLLLRLPALRSISLKCTEHLFFSRLGTDATMETFLLDVLEASSTN